MNSPMPQNSRAEPEAFRVVSRPGPGLRMERAVISALYGICTALPSSRIRSRASHFVDGVVTGIHPRSKFAAVEVEIAPGLSAVVNLGERVGADLFYRRGFETVELSIVQKLLEPGQVVFDVGANVGIYSLLSASLVGGGGVVHAFEPGPDVHKLLRRNVEQNGFSNIRLNQYAVSDTETEVQLFVNEESALSSLGDTGRGVVRKVETVQAVTLDEYSRRSQIERIDVLKIDVEGFEGHVLRGAGDLLDRSPEVAILSELADKNFAPLGLSRTSVFEDLKGRGFSLWEVDRQSRRLTPNPEGISRTSNQNFLFARPGSRAAAKLSQIAALGALNAPS